MTLSKDIKFDCAHVLSDYNGKCANLHGHTYHGKVTIIAKGPDVDTCMIMDYNDIKYVVDQFDHAVVFSAEAYRDSKEEALMRTVQVNRWRYVVVDGKSTAECISQYLVNEFLRMLRSIPGRVTVEVRLSETDGSWCFAKGVQENECC